MLIDDRTTTYRICFSQRKRRQEIPVYNARNDEEVKDVIDDVFKGRFRRPQALSYSDGVRIIVKRIDLIRHTVTHIKNTVIYNKSVRQAREEIEIEIRKRMIICK